MIGTASSTCERTIGPSVNRRSNPDGRVIHCQACTLMWAAGSKDQGKGLSAQTTFSRKRELLFQFDQMLVGVPCSERNNPGEGFSRVARIRCRNITVHYEQITFSQLKKILAMCGIGA
jgi:hypothetical protein